ncbi:CoA transferase [Catenovulum sp. 2E275]|uniref:CaiB/BaiF CoA transferase family protein n=1 Tax=Catenovulum sp. 2E275 TaxID=2980497 RepID=UPI0021CEDB65|nr:CaiB/BaiF CoA-transferase family protein [Catenovulum sp. 2E275]MCU4675632.1 CoA transferase [Catenovulum sp. 2E275]
MNNSEIMSQTEMVKPLDGLLVVDFTQFLSGPSATLRLADLGARVIKVERPGAGDICRSIYAVEHQVAGSSAFFQAINRNKESIILDLKAAEGIEAAKKLIAKADILTHNFRPQVMARLGLDYQSVKQINPNIVYAEISGYGNQGPWADRPGQDLLLQSLSGLSWLTGAQNDGPVPMGVAVADIFAGAQLVQGILAALVSGQGMQVEVSMLEAMLDFQFEPLTLYYQDKQAIDRGLQNAAHSLVGAPYGLYKTSDGFLALAMGAIPKLGELLNCEPLTAYTDSGTWFAKRDEIKKILANHLSGQKTQFWLDILEPADIWCAEVLNWQQLIEHSGFKVLNMLQTVEAEGGEYQTTRCPIRLDGQIIHSSIGAPSLGQHTANVFQELGL